MNLAGNLLSALLFIFSVKEGKKEETLSSRFIHLHVESDAALGHAHDEEHESEHGVDPGETVLGTPVQPSQSHPHPVQPPFLRRVPEQGLSMSRSRFGSRSRIDAVLFIIAFDPPSC